MKGKIIVGMETVVTSPQPPSPPSAEVSLDDSTMVTSDKKSKMEMKGEHRKSELLPSQRTLDDYILRVDWIREFPVTNEINGFELIVTDSKKGKMMMSHDDGMGGGCGGGHGEDNGKHGEHEDKGKHGEHEDKGKHGKSGMGGHEGGCPHFNMVKKSLPKVAALEGGVENLEHSLKMEIMVLGSTYPITQPFSVIARTVPSSKVWR
mgnify:CR=1 FL=1